jgi:hypothetical protein
MDLRLLLVSRSAQFEFIGSGRNLRRPQGIPPARALALLHKHDQIGSGGAAGYAKAEEQLTLNFLQAPRSRFGAEGQTHESSDQIRC